MKLTRFFLTFLFAAVAVLGFSQRGLQNFTDHKSGKAISYNRDNIVRVYPTSVGTKIWFNLGNPTDVDDAFEDVISEDPGLIQFTYVNKTNSLKFIGINPDYVVKAYPTSDSSQSVFIMKDGNTFLIDTAYLTAVSMLSVSAAAQLTTEEFSDASDTFYYAIPANAKSLTILGIGAGGGGGSGRRGAAGSARGGGSGGGSGAVSVVTISVDDITNDSLDIIVGAAGTGGAAVSVNSTSGNDGTSGGTTKVFLHGSSLQLLVASGGTKGLGGSTALVAGGAGGTIGDYPGYAGGAGDTTGVAGSSSVRLPGGGGGGGGGVGVTNVNRSGGDGGSGYYGLQAGGTGGAGGAAGTSPTAISSNTRKTGGGGSGAGGGGFAGTVGLVGAGGGGGSASANGTASGAGGNGGKGAVKIIANF